MNKLTQLLLVLVISLTVAVVVGFNHIESLNQDKATLELDKSNLTASVNSKQKTINDMEVLQKEANTIDVQHIKEMNLAKSNLENLQRGIANGTIGLHINAKCPAVSSSTEQAGASSMGDGTSPGLTDSAERDYFTLRERINTSTSQIGYLQDYIKNICNKPATNTQQ